MKWILILSIALALVFRVVLPFTSVFNDGVQLNTVDAYIMVRYADCWPDIPQYDYFSNYPTGISVGIYVWPVVIAIFSRIFGCLPIVGAAVLPPILFLLTLIPLYIIGRTLFNKWVAVGSVAIFCLLPGELLNRTMLGAGDYHAWELFLCSNIMMLIILAANDIQRKIDLFFYSAGAALLFIIYWFSWAGALWLIFIVGICLTIWVLLNAKPVLMGTYFLGVLGILAGIYLISPQTAIHYFNVAAGMFAVDIAATTTETMPLFFSFGKFDLNTSWLYFGITFYLVLIGLGWLIYRLKDKKPVDLVFLVWTIISLGMMIARRRFDYYFAFNAAIIASFVLVSVAQYLNINKATLIKIGVVIALAVCLPLIRADIYVSTADTYMPQDWRNATSYLKQYSNEKTYLSGSKGEFGVLSWWDYGYWIMEEAHLPVLSTPGTGDKGETSSILLSYENPTASLKNMRYVVVDEDMLKDKWYPITNGRAVEKEKTLLYKLCNQGEDGFKMVYQSGKVKVYQVE